MIQEASMPGAFAPHSKNASSDAPMARGYEQSHRRVHMLLLAWPEAHELVNIVPSKGGAHRSAFPLSLVNIRHNAHLGTFHEHGSFIIPLLKFPQLCHVSLCSQVSATLSNYHIRIQRRPIAKGAPR